MMAITFQRLQFFFGHQQVEVERLLWIIVAMICLYRPALNDFSFAAAVTIVHLLVTPWSTARSRRRRKIQRSSLYYTSGTARASRCHAWRGELTKSNSGHCGNNNTGGEDRPGVAMSIALVPCVLLSGIQQHHDPARILCCYYYSATLALLALWEWSPSLSDAATVIGSALVLQGCRVGRGDLLWWWYNRWDHEDLANLYRTMMVVDVVDDEWRPLCRPSQLSCCF
jgi:hypothetical protein